MKLKKIINNFLLEKSFILWKNLRLLYLNL